MFEDNPLLVIETKITNFFKVRITITKPMLEPIAVTPDGEIFGLKHWVMSSYIFGDEKYSMSGYAIESAYLEQAIEESKEILKDIKEHFHNDLTELLKTRVSKWTAKNSRLEEIRETDLYQEPTPTQLERNNAALEWIDKIQIPYQQNRLYNELGVKKRGKGNPRKPRKYSKKDKFVKDIIKHSIDLWNINKLTQTSLCSEKRLNLDTKTFNNKCKQFFDVSSRTVIKKIKAQLFNGEDIKLK